MVIALVTDLLFSSRIRAEASSHQRPVQICRSGNDFMLALESGTPDRIIIDLNSRGTPAMDVVRVCKERGMIDRVVAFCSHVDYDMQAQAAAQGVKHVVARSQFVKEIQRLVAV